MLKTSRENEREKRQQESGRTRQIAANYKQAQTCCCPLRYWFVQPWEMCLTINSDCTLTGISHLLTNTVLYVFSLLPHSLAGSLPSYIILGFLSLLHIFCAHQGRFEACFRNTDSFQSLGKFGTERACSLYQQIRKHKHTAPERWHVQLPVSLLQLLCFWSRQLPPQEVLCIRLVWGRLQQPVLLQKLPTFSEAPCFQLNKRTGTT